jgi:hypothetical protein
MPLWEWRSATDLMLGTPAWGSFRVYQGNLSSLILWMNLAVTIGLDAQLTLH